MTRRKRLRQKGRRVLDKRGMTALGGDMLRVRAYTSHEAATQGVEATAKEGADGQVTIYDVECLFELPVSPTETATGITTRFDISNPEYPSAEPTVVVISPRKPLCAHVAPESGVLCSGELWRECGGNEILAEFVLRVVRAYNFEEPPNDELGHQPAATQFARERLKGQPFNPDLVLPVIPEAIFRAAGRPSPSARPRLVIVSAEPRGAAHPAPMAATPRPRLIVSAPDTP